MDRDHFISIAAISEYYEDLVIDGHEIPLLFIGSNGVYVCMETSDEKAYGAVEKALALKVGQLFVFVVSDTDTGRLYDYKDHVFVEIEDNIYEAFENCYYNHLIPQAELFHIVFHKPADYCENVVYTIECSNYEEDAKPFVMPVIFGTQLVVVERRIEEIKNAPVCDGKYRIYPDGSMEIKRIVTESVAGVSTFIEKGEVYYPCMDTDGDQFFLLTLLGGLIGLHKYKTGNYLKGIFYTLTFGCCGVFYILDLIAIIIGGYNYRMIQKDASSGIVQYQRKCFYSRPVRNKKRAILLTIIASVLTVILVKFVYLAALKNLTILLSQLLAAMGFGKDLVNLIPT